MNAVMGRATTLAIVLLALSGVAVEARAGGSEGVPRLVAEQAEVQQALPAWLRGYDDALRQARKAGRRASANNCVAGPDATCDGVDDDCDGQTDEDFVGAACGQGVCARKAQCVNGIVLPCKPGSPTMALEVKNCDGLDNDCDGQTDEGYDDGIACTVSTCVGGKKSNVPNDALCDDGEPCTKDVCMATVGCAHVPDPSAAPDPAFDDGNPCTDLRCHQGKSQNLPDDTNVPDDGRSCTKDFCIGGKAYYEQIPGTCLVDGACFLPGETTSGERCGVCNPDVDPVGFTSDLFLEDFDAGLSGWLFQDHSAGGIGWQLDTQRKHSGSHALYFGNPSNHSYNSSKRVHASATSPVLKIAPSMVTQLEFRLWLDTEQTTSSSMYDTLYVEIIDAWGAVDTVWNSTAALTGTTGGQFYRVYLDMSDYAGEDVQVRFRFDTVDGYYNNYEGAYVDDLALHTVCCNTVADCDDGDPCTTELCDIDQCLYVHTCNPTCTIQPANVMMVLDYSGSMKDPGTVGDSISKWEASVTAIESALLLFGGVTNPALKLFRTPGAKGSCTVNQSTLEMPFGSSIQDIANYMYSQWPDGSTPIGAALTAARNIYAAHPYTDGRYVVLLTDGEEMCGGDPVQATKDLKSDGIETFVIGFGNGVDKAMLNEIALEGGHAKEAEFAGQPLFWNATSQQDLDYALSSIWADAVRERCNAIDDDCDGETDEDVKPVSCSVICNGVTLEGRMHCEDGALSPCKLADETELCNGVDDNCNGIVDDPWVDEVGAKLGEPCSVGTGVCEAPGVWVCPVSGLGEPTCAATPGPAGVEVCDGLDNDCDGLTDEDLERPCSFGCDVGVEVCYEGDWTGCTATLCEPDTQCDGVDNDGDGITDPLFPEVGSPCDGPDADGCVNGTYQCGSDLYSLVCVEAIVDLEEVCGGGDEDCDGTVDEDGALGCTLYLLDADGDGYGVGTPRCLCAPQGQWTAKAPGDCNDADASVHPGAAEVCDGVDNDCDGYTDEDPSQPSKPMSEPCYTGPAGTAGVGQCKPGKRTCAAGKWTPCAGEVTPTAETCNGLDDDCDGVGDYNEPNLAGGETDADHPCATAPQCKFGDCMCVQNPNSHQWGCILD